MCISFKQKNENEQNEQNRKHEKQNDIERMSVIAIAPKYH